MAVKIAGNRGRFGTRYGKSTRDKIARAESSVRKSRKSPFTNTNSVRRVSAGIWYCKKSGIKFTGKAYGFDSKNLLGKKSSREEIVEDI